LCRRQADEENDEATTKTSRNKSAENHIYMLSERRPRIGKGEVHLDLAFHLDGFALEKVRLEFPLLDGLNGSRASAGCPEINSMCAISPALLIRTRNKTVP